MKRHLFIPAIGARCGYILILALGMAGCQDQDIRVYRVPKEEVAMAGRPPHVNSDQAPSQTVEALIHWKAPNGWRQEPASGMRLASFSVPSGNGSKADMSVVVLPGPAGGTLANVNRWRGQLGLEPFDEKSLESHSQRINTQVGELTVVDFTGHATQEGDGSGKPRLLGAVFFDGASSWFFKMSGPDALVAQAKPSYLQFLKSLHFARHE